jgi:hypothetical protein
LLEDARCFLPEVGFDARLQKRRAPVIGGQAVAPFVVGALSAGFDENLRTAFLIVTPFSFLGAAILFRARRFLDADMQKIMLAVLTALQEDQARAQKPAE